ncbi:hypothetical protein RC083_08060 [Pseudoalteromonas haloplanktis]|uniref:Uncharacterized protein n=1 Tax=Pseudoalteromonas haloplanktis TaxID=228 RepID=A0ABU1BD58_PSEHA|nr:hypothetical protein [Pseudoalteromonas haloplanktis]MDQ9091542.1 hypothetical protein [Pseudoalteromonas haloplanktis]
MSIKKKKRNKKYSPKPEVNPKNNNNESSINNWFLTQRIISLLGISLVIVNLFIAIILKQDIYSEFQRLIGESLWLVYIFIIAFFAIIRFKLSIWIKNNKELLNKNPKAAKKIISAFMLSTIIAVGIFVSPIIYISGLANLIKDIITPYFPTIKTWVVDALVFIIQAIIAGVVGGYAYDKFKNKS